MTPIARALTRALRDLFRPRILLLALLPMVCALVLWGAVGFFFWTPLTGFVADVLTQWGLSGQVGAWDVGWLPGVLAGAAVLLALLSLAYVTAVLIASVFAMPVILSVVAERHYPDLAKSHGGSNTGSALNSLFALFTYIPLVLLMLPLWLVPPVGLAASILLTAYLNQRVFRYDALAEHASREERRQIVRRSRTKLWLLGILTALTQYIPVFNLVAPIYVGLSFTHFCLDRLAATRTTAGPASGALTSP